MMRCINCGLNVFRMRRHSLEMVSEEIRELVKQKNAFSNIPSDSIVCHSCWLLLHQSIETPDSCSDTKGHKNLCVYCGKSLHKIRKHILTNCSERESSIKAVVAEKCLPRTLHTSDGICHPCWQKCDSLVKRSTKPPTSSESSLQSTSAHPNVFKVDPLEPLIPLGGSTFTEVDPLRPFMSNLIEVKVEPSPSTLAEDKLEPSTPTLTKDKLEPPSSTLTEDNIEPSPPLQVPTIVLTQFSRAADTQSRCFFPGCNENERFLVPLPIRVRLFADFNFYVPPKCRICNYHLKGNLWHQLNENDPIHTFTEAHITDFTALLKTQKSIDFKNIDTIDDHLVHYWFGINKEQFHRLLAQVPKLSKTPKGPIGLAALLMKLRSGDSNTQIASLFQMPRSSLECMMSIAKAALHEDFNKIIAEAGFDIRPLDNVHTE